jgi:Kef-type K+ transport system membrane component KefB
MAARKRLTLYYIVLATVAVVGAVAIFAIGADAEPQPAIAGGYEVTEGQGCLSPKIVLRQSGQFVVLERADGARAGSPRFKDGRLTGDVTCLRGGTRQLDAAVEGRDLRGRVGPAPLAATLTEEPAAPGAQKPRPPASVDGEYKLVPASACLGGRLEIHGPSRALELEGPGGVHGEARYADGALAGSVTCAGGSGEAALRGAASNRDIVLTLAPAGGPPERVTAQKQRETGKTLAAFFIAITVVMLAARLAGTASVKLGQPRVMGEVVAGIALGPTLLGAVVPEVQHALFPVDIIPLLGAAANLGLIFYMFLVGLEIDLSQLRGRVAQTFAISNTGVVIPMLAGLAVAVPTYVLVGPDRDFAAFALFMGVAMSITAFPVLARILVERRMLKKQVGAIALASAAVDDVTAWFLIALATAVAVAGSASAVVRTVALAALFCVAMALLVRPLLARMSVAFDEVGRLPGAWITAIFAGILLAAYATEEIGIALIFGAFAMGAVMPRHAGLTEDVTHRIEDFVVLLLLPLFFAYTGLRTNIGLLDQPALIVLTLVLIVVAIGCKFGGTLLAARVTGLGWRESAVLGTLMNTRGLTELIVLNLALEKGVISEALFASLVLMALVTTFMAGPLLKRLDPRNEFGEPLEAELQAARAQTDEPVPERSIVVAPQTDAALAHLLALAEPLARSQPPRELVLARLVAPPRGASARGGLQTERFLVGHAAEELRAAREELLARDVAARAVAFTSTDPGDDLVRLTRDETVDLLLLDGRRPLLGAGIPRGPVGAALAEVPCDVAALVAREETTIALGPEAPVIVPFGGAEHDWAALELGAWLAAATKAPLKLLGAAGQTEDGRDAGRLLGNASLLVQRFVGVAGEAVIAPPGREGVLAAAAGGGLLVIGLSDRWRDEGLGRTRSEIAQAAPAPILFVRRGVRAGALAPRGDVTRFTWSSPGAPVLQTGTAAPAAPPEAR